MKLIKPSVEIREQGDGEDGMYQHIEWVGRHCYKSHDMITSDSARRFVGNLTKNGHGSVLEHGTIYLSIPAEDMPARLLANPYTKSVRCTGPEADWYAVTTNYRVILENDLLMYLLFDTPPTVQHERRITAKFICDRAVSHELVRHRVFSLAMESQRYCNYKKDKFGSQVTFIKPSWWDVASEDKEAFNDGLLNAETAYLKAVAAWEARKPDKRFRSGFKGNPLPPQAARMILPNATKTELVMTGFASDWEHFFDLRCSAAAHPDTRFLADKLKTLMISNNLITENNGD